MEKPAAPGPETEVQPEAKAPTIEGPARESWQTDPTAFARLFFTKEDDFKKRKDRKGPQNTEELKKRLRGRKVTWKGNVYLSSILGDNVKSIGVRVGEAGLIILRPTSESLKAKLAGIADGLPVEIPLIVGDLILPITNPDGGFSIVVSVSAAMDGG